MHLGKLCIIVGLLGTLVGCTKTAQRTDTMGNDITERVDYEKAAKLNIELGLGYLNQGQIARARTKLARAKKLAPNLSDVHYSYAYYLEYVGEMDEAEKSYLKAISLKPKGGKEHNNYGAYLCRQHNYRKAEKEFITAIDDPNYANTAEALENAGLCVLQMPDVAKASDYFEKALRHDQNRHNSYLELAIIKLKEHNYAQAKDYFERYNAIAKPSARSLLLGIELAKNSGDRNKESSYKLLLKSQFPDYKNASLYS